jgi:hypothetical protein
MFVAGFAAMADELSLLLEYQSACGALYEKLAVMSGLFMLGMAIAGFGVDHWVFGRTGVAAHSWRTDWATPSALVASAGFAALVSPLIRLSARMTPGTEELAYALLFFLAGAVLGAIVPSVAKSLVEPPSESKRGSPLPAMSETMREPRAAGLLSTMDHLGAMVGALTVGTLVLPALGTRATLEAVIVATSVAAYVVLSSSWAKPHGEPDR